MSQIWCLIVNGSSMITCSRMSVSQLCDRTIKQASAPKDDDHVRIKVSMGSDRSWHIPIQSETSWPWFLSIFGEKVAGMEAQGASARFEYDNHTIDSRLWVSDISRVA